MTKVGEVLKFSDRGLSVEDARKAMLAAGEAPSGIVREKAKNARVGFEEEVAPPVVAPAPVELEEMLPVDEGKEFVSEAPRPPVAKPTDAAPAPVVDSPKPKVERFENDQFVGEFRQEKGKWVAELQYKNGAGTEKWTRSTKDELMIALLEGKGNATLRVRAAKRRETMGVELDKQLPLPEDVTAEEFTGMSEKVQRELIKTITVQQIHIFLDEHPEYEKSERNWTNIDKFMKKHNLPMTAKNISHAFESLVEDEEMDVKKQAAPVQPSLATPAAPKPSEDSVVPPAPVAPAPAEAPAPEPGTVVRKRGSSGLQPGQSSVPSGDSVRSEDGDNRRDLSEAELRRLSPIGAPVSKDLRARANAERIANAQRRA